MELIGTLVLWLVLSYAVMVYAGKKGRSEGGFFLLSLLLSPLVAFIFIAVGPENPERAGLKKCPQCAEYVKIEAVKCRFCSADTSAFLPSQTVKASSRGFIIGAFVFVLGLAAIWAGTNFLLTERRENGELSAVTSMRTLATACIVYDNDFSRGYPPSLEALGPGRPGAPASPAAARLIDEGLASGKKGGYEFEYRPGKRIRGKVMAYEIIARPISGSGRRLFLDESAVIREDLLGEPSKHSMPLL